MPSLLSVALQPGRGITGVPLSEQVAFYQDNCLLPTVRWVALDGAEGVARHIACTVLLRITTKISRLPVLHDSLGAKG